MVIKGGRFEPFQYIYNLRKRFDEVQLIMSRAHVKNL